MRVLACFTDPRYGGPAKRSIAIAEQLEGYGVDVEFLIPYGAESFAEAIQELDNQIFRMDLPRLRSIRKIPANIKFLTTFAEKTDSLVSLISSEEFDIIHVNTPYNFQPALATAKSDPALLWHFNDLLTPWPINRIAGMLANRWADGIAVSCERVKDYFGIKTEPTRVLYPPVDLSEFDPEHFSDSKPDICSEFGIDPETFLMGIVGNINPIKGQDVLIEAIEQVYAEYRKISLLIVGADLDSQRQYYVNLRQKIESKGLDDIVHFAGWRSDVPRFLAAFDLSIVASRAETGPLVALEAMAMGTPLVSTSVGAVKERAIDGKHAWIVESENPQSLANAIIEAIRFPDERKKRASEAITLVKKEFSLKAAVDKHYSLYCDLIKM